MRWFTSDLHLGHENIIRYCHRPFSDVTAMNTELVNRWNERVDSDDEVWVLGDFAMGQITDGLAVVAHLHGRKVLVTGNHDRCWPAQPRRPADWELRYRDAGFADVLHGTVSVDLGGHHVLAGHFPYEGDSHDEDRFTRFRPQDNGQWLLHGHVHTRWQVHSHQINVGVDVWDYRPVSADTLEAIIDEASASRPDAAGASAL